MSEQPILGPACDLCGQEPALGSIMSLADYSTIKFGPACVVGFLRDYADQIEAASAADTAAAQPAAPGATETAPAVPAADDTDGPQIGSESYAVACPVCGSVGQYPVPDPEEHTCGHTVTLGSKSEHWASTRAVVKSTHGHRKPRAAGAPPPPDDTA